MKLDDIINKDNLKEAAKIAGAVAVGVGLAYTMEKIGVNQWMKDFNSAAYGILGDWAKNNFEFMYNHVGKYANHFAFFTLGAIPTYIGLDKLIK